MPSLPKPIAIFYEHPDWFRPLFAELDRRGTPYQKLNAAQHRYSIADHNSRYALLFNRMSPSAWARGHGHAIFYTLHFLAHLEAQGVRVVNGARAFAVEISKARQLSLLESLRLPYPAARVIHHPAQAAEAARGLRFPVIVKPNIGGSGVGIVRFDHPEEIERAAAAGRLHLGPDHTALVQEYIPPRDDCIVRVEVLGGKFLYAIRIHLSGEGYNLCPADICQTADGRPLERLACPADAPRTGLRVEACTPPPDVIAAVERIAHAAGIEVGGVEYLVDDRDGRRLFYDVNALSNFVADAVRVVGFNPHARLVDYLEQEAR